MLWPKNSLEPLPAKSREQDGAFDGSPANARLGGLAVVAGQPAGRATLAEPSIIVGPLRSRPLPRRWLPECDNSRSQGAIDPRGDRR